MTSPLHLDPFDALGVPPRFDLDPSTLRAAWLRRASGSHPDAGGSVSQSALENAALIVLSDPVRRAEALLARWGAPVVGPVAPPLGFLAAMIELRERADAAEIGCAEHGALIGEAQAGRMEAIEVIQCAFARVRDESISEVDAREVRVQLQVVRGYERMMEQLEREASGS